MSVYYISATKGADHLAGSESEPWKTIGAAASRVKPFDEVRLFPDRYREGLLARIADVRWKALDAGVVLEGGSVEPIRSRWESLGDRMYRIFLGAARVEGVFVDNYETAGNHCALWCMDNKDGYGGNPLLRLHEFDPGHDYFGNPANNLRKHDWKSQYSYRENWLTVCVYSGASPDQHDLRIASLTTGIRLEAPRVTVEGIAVRRFRNAVETDGAHGSILDKCELRFSARSGMWLTNSDKLQVIQCIVQGGGSWIGHFEDVIGTLRCHALALLDSDFSYGGHSGILLQGSDEALIRRCKIHDCGGTLLSFFKSSDDCIVEDTDLFRAGTVARSSLHKIPHGGVQCVGSRNQFRRVRVHDTGKGFAIYGDAGGVSNDNVIEDSEVIGAEEACIQIGAGSVADAEYVQRTVVRNSKVGHAPLAIKLDNIGGNAPWRGTVIENNVFHTGSHLGWMSVSQANQSVPSVFRGNSEANLPTVPGDPVDPVDPVDPPPGDPVLMSITPSSGKPGVTVTAKGSRFTAGAAPVVWTKRGLIRIAGEQFVHVSDAVIVINTPADTETGPIYIRTNTGKSNSMEFTVTSDTPTPTPTAPRIWLSDERLAQLRADAAAGSPRWLALQQWLDLGEPYVWQPGIFGHALGYLVTGEARYAERAIALMMSDVAKPFSAIERDKGFDVRLYLPRLAVGYNWLRDRLTADQAAAIRGRMIEWANWVWPETNPERQGKWATDNGAVGDNYWHGFQLGVWLVGLALGEQGFIDRSRRRWVEVAKPWLEMNAEGGPLPEGTAYAAGSLQSIWMYLAAHKTATGEDLTMGTTWLRDYILFLLHATVPTRDRIYPGGDQSLGSDGPINDYKRSAALWALSHLDAQTAGYARWWLDTVTPNRQQWQQSLWEEFFCYRADIAAIDYALTLSPKYWADGIDWVTVRTGWGRDDVQVVVQCGPMWSGHGEPAAGTFSLFRGDWLVGRATQWSHGGIAKDCDWSNCPTIGGFKQTLQGSARIIDFSHGDGYSVIIAEFGQAYDTPAQDPLNEARRTLVLLKEPKVLLVFDRLVSPNPALAATWHLNTKREPTIFGSRYQVAAGDNRLFGRCLLPEGAVPVAVPVHLGNAGALSSWRIDISAAAGRAETLFLNVLEADPGSEVVPTPVELIAVTDPAIAAVKVGEWEVEFFEDGDAIVSRGTAPPPPPPADPVIISVTPNPATVGDLVSVIGTDFDTVAGTPFFGNSPVDILDMRAWLDTFISFIAPNIIGTKPLVVERADGKRTTPLGTYLKIVPLPPDIAALRAIVFAGINVVRVRRGSPAVTRSTLLDAIAQGTASQFAAANWFSESHVGPDGRTWQKRLVDGGYRSSISLLVASEIGARDVWPEDVAAAWETSPLGHGTHLLNPIYKEAGVGVAFSPGGRPYIFANFGIGQVTQPPPPQAPAAPSELTVGAATEDSLTLTWNDNSANESTFEVQSRDNGLGDWETIRVLPMNSTHYTEDGLPTATTFRYRVRAVNAAGASPWSNEASGTTLPVPPPPPPPRYQFKIAVVVDAWQEGEAVNLEVIEANATEVEEL